MEIIMLKEKNYLKLQNNYTACMHILKNIYIIITTEKYNYQDKTTLK